MIKAKLQRRGLSKAGRGGEESVGFFGWDLPCDSLASMFCWPIKLCCLGEPSAGIYPAIATLTGQEPLAVNLGGHLSVGD